MNQRRSDGYDVMHEASVPEQQQQIELLHPGNVARQRHRTGHAIAFAALFFSAGADAGANIDQQLAESGTDRHADPRSDRHVTRDFALTGPSFIRP